MDVRTYRARSMQDALRLVRDELGPDAAVLHTREVSAGMLGGLFGGRQIEVTASTDVNVPSRLPEGFVLQPTVVGAETAADTFGVHPSRSPSSVAEASALPGGGNHFRSRLRDNLQSDDSPSLIDELSQRDAGVQSGKTAFWFELFTDLVDAGIPDTHARELLDAAKRRIDPRDVSDPLIVKSHVTRLVEEMLRVRGPIRLAPGRCTVVALVGPTGVGKTTTIAKLAAHFRLKEKGRVGLVTIDTYRIAAVEQLRTYAEIMDLPMEVVATPRDMQAAIERLSHLDLVLVDTAGRSPRDEAHIHELRSVLAQADADEVHLALSSVTSAEALQRSVERFRDVGATHLVLTKVDEAAGLGSLLPMLKRCELPVTYITHGQDVPNDIAPAQRRSLARMLMGE